MNVAQHFERHHAVVSRTEARKLGMSDRMISRRISSGRWVRLAPQVYRLAGASQSWLGTQRAHALSAGGLVSHRSAAAVYRLPGYGSRRVELTIDFERSVQHRPGVLMHRSKQMHLADATEVRAVPVTGLARTVLDLAAVVGADKLEEAVDHVVGQKLLTWPDLYETLVRHSAKGRDGCGKFRALLDARYGDAEIPDSVFNRRVGRLLDDALLAQDFRYEYEVRCDRDGFLGRADIAFPHEKLLIECDSVKFHLNRPSFVGDRRRQNKLTTAGWTVLNFTWWDYTERPGELVDTVKAALDAATPATLQDRQK